MPIFTDEDLSGIQLALDDIIGDSSINTTISYRLAGTTVTNWSPTMQTIPDMFLTSSVSAFKGSYTLDEVEQSGGLIEYGDIKFIFMSSDVSGTLSTSDIIAESSTTFQSATTYMVKAISKDPLDMVYFITGRTV